MAQQAASLATHTEALPPRYEYLLEIEQSGGARCHLAIDPGTHAPKPPAAAPFGGGAEVSEQAGPASAVRSAQACGIGVAERTRASSERRLVTVHLAPAAVAEDDELRARFAARAAAFLPLRHPNLVSTFEAVSERRGCHWVSEFVPGQPLSRLLTKRTKRGQRALRTRQILAILRDAARALEHAHCAVDVAGLPRPVVHLNLSPGSVLVTYDGVVKVSGDVGCGSSVVSAGSDDGLPARLACLAPECCSGGRGDARSDVYALGAILWGALAGRPRSLGLTPEQVVALRLRGGEPDLESVCPEALPALAAVTRRALATDPVDRHQSVGALREELEELARLDVLKNETSWLFGFMCNHFCEEYAALQALLDEHSMLHALFGKRLMSPMSACTPSQTGARVLLQMDARALSDSGYHSRSQTEAPAALQCPIEERAGQLSRASDVHEARELPLRESGLRRVPEAGIQAPTTASRAISLVIPDLPLAKHQLPTVALPLARAFSRTKSSVVVLMLAGALAVLGLSWLRQGTSAAGPFERAEPAALVPRARLHSSESVDAEPASAASALRSPSALGSMVGVEPAAAAAAIPAHPMPERGGWKRLRPVRGNPRSRTTRGDSPIETAAGAVTRTTHYVATRSELDEESSDGAGVDLRMLKERPPRAIDKQDPYSP